MPFLRRLAACRQTCATLQGEAAKIQIFPPFRSRAGCLRVAATCVLQTTAAGIALRHVMPSRLTLPPATLGSVACGARPGQRNEHAYSSELCSPGSFSASTICEMIYTTNAIEALNSKLRRAVKIRGHFPNDDAAMKLIYLA